MNSALYPAFITSMGPVSWLFHRLAAWSTSGVLVYNWAQPPRTMESQSDGRDTVSRWCTADTTMTWWVYETVPARASWLACFLTWSLHCSIQSLQQQHHHDEGCVRCEKTHKESFLQAVWVDDGKDLSVHVQVFNGKMQNLATRQLPQRTLHKTDEYRCWITKREMWL